MDWKLEVVVVPVTDVDRAKGFYVEQVGFVVDHDTRISDDMRVVQLTPPGSGCSIVIGVGMLDAPPGSVQGTQLVVPDIEAARAELVERGVEVSAVQHFDGADRVDGHGGDWNSFVFFSDPDGNGWVVQERPARREPPTSIAPQLSVRRGRAAVEFYQAAFGAVQDYRVAGTDEHEAVVAQLSVGDASFWVSDESPPHANFSPESLGGGTVRMLLVVADPDSFVARAVASGASVVYPVAEEHGWRLGRIVDPFGHHWEIGKPLVAWPPGP